MLLSSSPQDKSISPCIRQVAGVSQVHKGCQALGKNQTSTESLCSGSLHCNREDRQMTNMRNQQNKSKILRNVLNLPGGRTHLIQTEVIQDWSRKDTVRMEEAKEAEMEAGASLADKTRRAKTGIMEVQHTPRSAAGWTTCRTRKVIL